MRIVHAVVAFSLVASIACSALRAHDEPGGEMKSAAEIAKASADMANAANSLIACLDDEQKKSIQFDFKDAEREKFIFVPKPDRRGLSIKNLTPFQRPLAFALLNSGLSQRGFGSALSIMSLEQVLNDAEKGKGPKRDAELYFIEIFGTPGADQIWAWRFEGHHFSASFTSVMGKAIIAAPLFMGCNPEVVKDGPRKGYRTLGEVEDAGRKFLAALNDDQKKKAIIKAETPKDILTMTSRKVEMVKEGLSAKEMTKEQKDLLLDLVRQYVQRDRAEVAAQDMARIEKEGVDTISFAWAGPTELGKTHYYRIHSDSFLIEYDNFQNDGNHIHSVYRDLKNDFGEDLLKAHYAAEHKN